MGVDCEIHFKLSSGLSDSELATLNWRFCEATGLKSYHDDHMVLRPRSSGPSFTDYSVATTHRYYGPGYERGPWPEIAGILEWLRRQPEVSELRYGGDSGGCEDLELVTPGLLESLWAHWAKVGGVPYSRGRDTSTAPVPQCHGQPIFVNRWHGSRRGGHCPVCGQSYWIEGSTLVPISKESF